MDGGSSKIGACAKQSAVDVFPVWRAPRMQMDSCAVELTRCLRSKSINYLAASRWRRLSWWFWNIVVRFIEVEIEGIAFRAILAVDSGREKLVYKTVNLKTLNYATPPALRTTLIAHLVRCPTVERPYAVPRRASGQLRLNLPSYRGFRTETHFRLYGP